MFICPFFHVHIHTSQNVREICTLFFGIVCHHLSGLLLQFQSNSLLVLEVKCFFCFFFTQTRVQLSGPHRTNEQQTVPVCVDTEKRGGLTRGCLFALNSWQFVSSQFVVPWESARPPSLERWWGGTVHHIPAGSCQPLPGADGTYTV